MSVFVQFIEGRSPKRGDFMLPVAIYGTRPSDVPAKELKEVPVFKDAASFQKYWQSKNGISALNDMDRAALNITAAEIESRLTKEFCSEASGETGTSLYLAMSSDDGFAGPDFQGVFTARADATACSYLASPIELTLDKAPMVAPSQKTRLLLNCQKKQ